MNEERYEAGFRPFICIYPGIKRWMERNDMNVSMLSKKSKIPVNTLWCNFSGKSDPRMYTIRRILETTGLTFEQAFGEQINQREAREER